MSTGPGTFRANIPPLDIEGIERDLVRIPAVRSARVVVRNDELQEIHVVCGGPRAAKLVGRDVQSLLAAQWGLDVDHRKVSVVQVAEDEEPLAVAVAPAPVPVMLATVMQLAVSSGGHAEASVSIDLGGTRGAGSATGDSSWRGQQRAVAEATLDAVATLDPSVDGYGVADVLVSAIGGESVAVVSLIGVQAGLEVRTVGAAAVGSRGELRAVADAVLRAFRH